MSIFDDLPRVREERTEGLPPFTIEQALQPQGRDLILHIYRRHPADLHDSLLEALAKHMAEKNPMTPEIMERVAELTLGGILIVYYDRPKPRLEEMATGIVAKFINAPSCDMIRFIAQGIMLVGFTEMVTSWVGDVLPDCEHWHGTEKED